MKADLHLHTCYSPDSNSSLDGIVRHCQKIGIDCLAVTDHDTIEGGLRMQEIAPFKVIVGEEVRSTEGEIIGYFLKEEIPGGLTPVEVISRIKEQGGLVCLPHPFDGLGRYPLKAKERDALLSQIDIIEVFNARSIRNNIAQAESFADEHGLLKSAGSDAHSTSEVGNAYVEMSEFDGPDDFRKSLGNGQILGHRNSIRNRVFTLITTMPKRLKYKCHV